MGSTCVNGWCGDSGWETHSKGDGVKVYGAIAGGMGMPKACSLIQADERRAEDSEV